MKNITKIILVLFTSVSLVGSVSAGELTVTGTAKATYNIVGGGTEGANLSKGIGVANEIDFGAKGELDNGWTWNYQVQFDPTDGASAAADGNATGVDDARLELTTGYGMFGVYAREGGLDVDNSASQSVYGRPSDIGVSTGMTDGPGLDSFNNLQYHLPTGMLPFGMTVKAGYATGQNAVLNSSNAEGAGGNLFGDNAAQYQVTASPVTGFKIGADYYVEDGAGDATQTVVQQFEAGSAFVTYKTDSFSVGISQTRRAPLILSTGAAGSAAGSTISNNSAAGGNADSARLYKSNKMSAAFNMNEAISVSYEQEKSSRELIANASESDINSRAIQVAYTMGGMTLAVSHGDTQNPDYTAGGTTEDRKSVV